MEVTEKFNKERNITLVLQRIQNVNKLTLYDGSHMALALRREWTVIYLTL